jgi:hypothetical protein
MLQSYLHFRHHFSKKTNAASTTPCPPQLSPSHCIADRHAVPKLPPWWMVQDPCIAIQIQGGYISEVWKWGNETCQLFEAFQFFSDEHGNVLGFDLLSNTPTVCGMAFDCHVRPKHHFSSWLSHLPQNYANQLRASSFCGWNRKKLYPPTLIKYMPEENPSKSHIWYPFHIKIAFRCSFPQQNSMSRHRCWSILVFQSTKFIFAWQPHLCSLMARVIPVISQ